MAPGTDLTRWKSDKLLARSIFRALLGRISRELLLIPGPLATSGSCCSVTTTLTSGLLSDTLVTNLLLMGLETTMAEVALGTVMLVPLLPEPESMGGPMSSSENKSLN